MNTYGLSRPEWCELIDNWIFNATHREILKDRLLDGMSFDEIAEKYDYSVQHIKSIVYKSTKNLINHI